MSVRKISDLPEVEDPWKAPVCSSPEHKPPMHIVLDAGIYEHVCPRCGTKTTFTVGRSSHGEYPRVVADRHPITHVAIRHRDHVWSLPKPFRHNHIFEVIRHLEHGPLKDASGDNQGFLDASGRYLTRDQAMVSARIFNQIKNGKIIGGVLTSEDLW